MTPFIQFVNSVMDSVLNFLNFNNTGYVTAH